MIRPFFRIVIASEAKQSTYPLRRMLCFVASLLAMTRLRYAAACSWAEKVVFKIAPVYAALNPEYAHSNPDQ
jgi:hypothetical protein